MSSYSDIHVLDGSFFPDPLSTFTDFSIDILQADPVDDEANSFNAHLNQLAELPSLEVNPQSTQLSLPSPCFPGQPRFGAFMESPENGFSAGQIRRVFSTGDSQMEALQTSQRLCCSATAGGESPLMEEANFKVGRYSAEERKERIHRYRAKRTQRNFNKTIKYACRKTLAETRPRIRGRFARNDEAGDIPKSAGFHASAEEDDLWVIIDVVNLGNY